MKISPYKYYWVIVLSLWTSCVVARGGDDVEKRKTIEKGYIVKKEVLLNISNSFGKVHINTTDGNEISVKIDIIARNRNAERALDVLSKINVDIDETGNEIKFITRISGLNNRGSEHFEVNYNISMPTTNPLKLENSYGDAYVGNLSSVVDVKIAYGDVRVKELTGDNTRLKVSFGDADIEYVKSGHIEIKYSDVNFEKLGDIKLVQSFSDLDIDEVNTLNLTSKYGDIDIGSVQGIKGYIGFTEVSLDYLGKEIDIETSYLGDFSVDRVSKNFDMINITGKFGGYELDFEEGTNASFEVEVKFSDFDLDYSDASIHYTNKSDFRGEYRGKMGNGTGGKINIISNYGDVEFN